jgi:cytochrome c553
MFRMPGIVNPAVALALGLLCNPADAADIAAGKAKAEAVCQTCHGMDGRGTSAMIGNIGGQQKQYLAKQLGDFRAGRRQHEQMSIIAQMLSDEDIDNVTEWYSHIIASFEIPE